MISLLGIFDAPPDWSKGTIYCIGQKSDSWSKPGSYRLSDIPEQHRETLASIVKGFTTLSNEWYCTQFWAAFSYRMETVEPESGEQESTRVPGIAIRMECRHKDTGALRLLAPKDNPALWLTDSASMALYSALCGD